MNPFGGSEKISGLGEKGLISRICAAFGGAVPPPPFGAGDDCAVVPSEKFCGRKMLATSDAVIFGRHFDESSEPSLVGKKFVNRQIPDCENYKNNALKKRSPERYYSFWQ